MDTQNSLTNVDSFTRPTVAVLIGQNHYQRMLDRATWERLRSFADVVEHQGGEPAAKVDLLAILPPADACITSWGVAQLDAEVMAAAPRLRAMAHMGSSVKRFVSDALWAQNVHVTTAAPALAEDVAVTALGLMIVGMKRIWPLGQHVRAGGWRESDYWPSREIRNKVVGVVGASHVGRHLIRLLGPFEVELLLFDPFIGADQAAELGVELVPELDELLSRADIVTLHAPAKPSSVWMIAG